MFGTTYLSIYMFGVCDTKKGQSILNFLEINSNEPDVSKINENSFNDLINLKKVKLNFLLNLIYNILFFNLYIFYSYKFHHNLKDKHNYLCHYFYLNN